MSALEKCSFGRRPAAKPFPRHSDDEALFEPMSGRLRKAVTAPDSTWSSLSSPGARSVPRPMRREQISFPNPRRMESKCRSPMNFCFPLRMRRFCFGHSRANEAFTTPNLPDEGAEPGAGANAYVRCSFSRGAYGSSGYRPPHGSASTLGRN